MSGRTPLISGVMFALVIFSLVASLIAGCSKSKSIPLDLTIHFTCDTRGRLVPCGCFSGQFGGLTRLKTVLDADPATNALRVDVGDAIGGQEDYHLVEYRQILKAYAAMRFAAMNIGHREAQLSARQLRELAQSSPVPLISANLVEKATGKPLFESHRLVKYGPWTVAIIGALDPRGLGDDLGEGLAVEKMEDALGRLLPEVRPKADLVVLLAFTDEATLAQLAHDFYEVDVILGGKVRQPAQKLTRENRSLIFFTTNESRALGLLRLRLLARSKLSVLGDEILLLHDRIPENPSIQALAAEYRTQVRGMKLRVDSPERLQEDMVPGVRAVASFAGTDRCLECHQGSAAVWRRTGHAQAFATLVRKQADGDPKCIVCHTVGFGSVSGYRREFGRGKLVDVGCESCHGPGSLHVRQQEGDAAVSFKFRPLGAGDCQKCHYGEFSRPFDWEKFWPRVAHSIEPEIKDNKTKPARAAATPAGSPPSSL